jgi:hypothetical protein
VTLLQHCHWLRQVQLRYWGDIDAHGLAILSQVRGYFSETQSLLMDRATWDAHQAIATPGKPYRGSLPQHLTPEEHLLFQHTVENMLRIEQEQLRFEWVQERI